MHQVLETTGASAFGRVEAQSPDRATEAAEALTALFTQNGQNTIANSPKAILHISASEDQMPEIEELTYIIEHVVEVLLEDAELILSYNKDASLHDSIQVSLLAAV